MDVGCDSWSMHHSGTVAQTVRLRAKVVVNRSLSLSPACMHASPNQQPNHTHKQTTLLQIYIGISLLVTSIAACTPSFSPRMLLPQRLPQRSLSRACGRSSRARLRSPRLICLPPFRTLRYRSRPSDYAAERRHWSTWAGRMGLAGRGVLPVPSYFTLRGGGGGVTVIPGGGASSVGVRAASDATAEGKGNGEGGGGDVVQPKKRARAKPKPKPKATKADPKPKPKPKPKLRPAQRNIPRDETPRLQVAGRDRSEVLKIISWNVAGLRAVLNNKDKLAALKRLVKEEDPDVLCLQETKLQESHVEGVAASIMEAIGMRGVWSCSTGRKGYSGTVILLKSSSSPNYTLPLSLPSPVMEAFDGPGDFGPEGRGVVATFGRELRLLNFYVPNSGADLKRLGERVDGWDAWLRGYVQDQRAASSPGEPPLVICGDLNVAHEDIDFFCPENKAYEKLAGTTPQERRSFSLLLDNGTLVDTFRQLHPKASGVYSYWSQRARNRDWNRGLRLDYFVAERELLQCDSKQQLQSGGDAAADAAANADGCDGGIKSPSSLVVLDSFVLDTATVGTSDHAPVGLWLGRRR